MTIAFWIVFAMILYPLIFTGIAKAGGKDFNNKCPRDYLAGLSGWKQRANWVQENAYEGFAPFAAAVIIAHLLGVVQTHIDGLAIAYLVLRVVYGVCYLADLATLRSLVWMGSLGCVIALFVLAA